MYEGLALGPVRAEMAFQIGSERLHVPVDYWAEPSKPAIGIGFQFTARKSV